MVDYEVNYDYEHHLLSREYDEDYLTDDDYTALINREESLPKLVEYRIKMHSTTSEISNLVVNCMTTILFQGMSQIKLTIILCLLIKFTLILLQSLRIMHFKSIQNLFHIFVSLCGIFVLHNIFQDIFVATTSIFCMFVLVLYVVTWWTDFYKVRSGLYTSVVCICCIIFGELGFSNPQLWNRIRGVLLLVCMKIISVAFDIEEKDKHIGFPTFLEYISYCLHPGLLVYGPWLSLSDFRDYINVTRPLNFDWIFCVIRSAIQAAICLAFSDCVLPYLFVDPLQPQSPAIFPVVGNKWLMSYSTAVSFHFSHYYICYLSVLTCASSGLGGYRPQKKQKTDDDDDVANQLKISWSKFVIVRPFRIEVPWSMLNVVVAWNIPMSRWLKRYVFDVSKKLGNSLAILFTYAASAMLHGLSFHLAAVLMSLALYTYAENALRLKLSRVLGCIHIQARPPKMHDSGTVQVPLWAKLFNLVWVCINIVHLAYLGSMFESSSEEDGTSGYSINFTLAKWSELGFVSHLFAVACLIINWLIQ